MRAAFGIWKIMVYRPNNSAVIQQIEVEAIYKALEYIKVSARKRLAVFLDNMYVGHWKSRQ